MIQATDADGNTVTLRSSEPIVIDDGEAFDIKSHRRTYHLCHERGETEESVVLHTHRIAGAGAEISPLGQQPNCRGIAREERPREQRL